MDIVLITGSAGLIGSESVEFFADKFDLVVGIDNNMRAYFFGADASTKWNRERIENEVDLTELVDEIVANYTLEDEPEEKPVVLPPPLVSY